MQKSVKKTILPFAASKAAAFNGDVEKAAVFCMAELNREKGGGFFKKQNAEKLVFVSKVLYPFWVAPFKEVTLLLDGLNVASYSITCLALPDLKAFMEKLNEHQLTRQVHINFLSNNQNYFQNLNNEQKITIDGLVNDTEFVGEFLTYTKEGTTTDLPIIDAVLVTPALDGEGVLKMLQNIEGARLKLLEELSDLNEIIKLLNLRRQESQDSLREEIKSVENEYTVKIQKVKGLLEDKIAKINKAYSDAVTEVSGRFEQKILVLQKDVVTFEKEKEQLEAEIEHVESEIKTAAVNKDDSAEQKWKEKRNELKDRRPEIASKLKELGRQIREVEEAEKSELFQLKQDNEGKIKEASKDLLEIEAARDAEIKVFQSDIEKIEQLTSNIIENVNEKAKKREATVLEFDQLSVKQKITEQLLVYMPFYLSCYQSKSNKRYTYLAPSDVSHGGLSTRLKAFGKTKISQLFQPRHRKINSILNSFISLMDENIVFNREISEACLKANILQTETQESVRTGLIKLRDQGWLSNSEFDEFSYAITQNFPSKSAIA